MTSSLTSEYRGSAVVEEPPAIRAIQNGSGRSWFSYLVFAEGLHKLDSEMGDSRELRLVVDGNRVRYDGVETPTKP